MFLFPFPCLEQVGSSFRSLVSAFSQSHSHQSRFMSLSLRSQSRLFRADCSLYTEAEINFYNNFITSTVP